MLVINKQNGKINVFIGGVLVNYAQNSYNTNISNTYTFTVGRR